MSFTAVAWTLRDPGLTWDESIFFGFSQRYWVYFTELGRSDWYDLPEMTDTVRQAHRKVPRPWGPLSRPVIDQFWHRGQVHPPLGPLCYAAGLTLFHFFTDAITAFRLPAAFLFAFLILATYRFFAWRPPLQETGARQNEHEVNPMIWGGVSAIALLLMPRIFGEGHFAALDLPMSLMWLLTVIAFRQGVYNRRWAAASGLIFGLALLTKVNAVLLPLALWPWGVLTHGRRSLAPILCMLILGPIIFVVGWPWLWHDPFTHAFAYLADKVSRLHIPVYYLGRVYSESPPPWHYPFVMTAVTMPLGLLAPLFLGLPAAAKRRADSTCSLTLTNLIVIYGVAASPWVPKYDGVRLFLPAFPFVAGLAGLGLIGIWRQLCSAQGASLLSHRLSSCAARTAAAALGLILLRGVLVYHPYELSYYGGCVGGLAGARKLGFETQYWGDVFNREAQNAVNQLCPSGAAVCIRPLDMRVPLLLQANGELKKDLRFVTESEPHEYLVLLARESYFHPDDWALFDRTQRSSAANPKLLWESRLRGVPLCRIFRIPGPS